MPALTGTTGTAGTFTREQIENEMRRMVDALGSPLPRHTVVVVSIADRISLNPPPGSLLAGMRIVESPIVRQGEAYLIDAAALDLRIPVKRTYSKPLSRPWFRRPNSRRWLRMCICGRFRPKMNAKIRNAYIVKCANCHGHVTQTQMMKVDKRWGWEGIFSGECDG